MATYDLVIKGGTVIDGLRTPRYRADVGIADGRIAEIGPHQRRGRRRGGRRVRAGRRARLRRPAHALRQPGVLGPVVHDVGVARRHERRDRQLRLRLRAVQARGPERAMLTMSRNEAVPLKTMRAGMPWDWETFPEFLDSVDRTPKGVNMMSLVPLAPAVPVRRRRRQGQGAARTDEELDKMCQLIVEGMEAGGCGWSSQILGRRRQHPARLRRHADGHRPDDRA